MQPKNITKIKESQVSHESIKYTYILVYFIIYSHKIYTNLLIFFQIYFKKLKFTKTYLHKLKDHVQHHLQLYLNQININKQKDEILHHNIIKLTEYVLHYCNNFLGTSYCYCGELKCCEYLLKRPCESSSSLCEPFLSPVHYYTSKK